MGVVVLSIHRCEAVGSSNARIAVPQQRRLRREQSLSFGTAAPMHVPTIRTAHIECMNQIVAFDAASARRQQRQGLGPHAVSAALDSVLGVQFTLPPNQSFTCLLCNFAAWPSSGPKCAWMTHRCPRRLESLCAGCLRCKRSAIRTTKHHWVH